MWLEKKIDGEIVSHGRDRKVVVFKFKRRKGYQKKNTHRDEYTILKFGKLGTVKKQATTKKKVAEKKESSKKIAPKTAASIPEVPKAPSKKIENTKKEKE